MWMWRFWLIGLNVGRWDYTASLIEMWNEKVLPDPQNGPLMGMTAKHMMHTRGITPCLTSWPGDLPLAG